MKLIDRDTNKDAIMAYLKNPESEIDGLSEKQRELLQYYVDAYSIRRNYASMPDAIAVLVKLSKQRGKPISSITARRYIVDAMDLIGEANKVTKEAARQYGLEIISDAIAMARDQNDPKTMILGAKAYIEAGAADEPEGFNPADIEQHVIEIALDDKAKKMLEYITGKGTIDLDRLMSDTMNNMAEDAEIIPDDGK
jgi:hypothetical protein